MQEIYKRKLRYSEAKRHYIRIDNRHRDMFPPYDEDFDVIVNDIKLLVRVDKLNRIWAAIFWERLPHFREGDSIVFSKNLDGSFNVSIEE